MTPGINWNMTVGIFGTFGRGWVATIALVFNAIAYVVLKHLITIMGILLHDTFGQTPRLSDLKHKCYNPTKYIPYTDFIPLNSLLDKWTVYDVKLKPFNHSFLTTSLKLARISLNIKFIFR